MEKYIDIDFAKLDIERKKRRGGTESVFCECKTGEQLVKIFSEFENRGRIFWARASQKNRQMP